MDMTGRWIVSLGAWNWFIAGGRAVPARDHRARQLHDVARAVRASGRARSRSCSTGRGRRRSSPSRCSPSRSIPVWRRFARKVEQPAERPFLNRRAEGYVGRVFTLDKPIVDGIGTIRIDDTVWRVSGPDCPAGSRVKIARADGAQTVDGVGSRLCASVLRRIDACSRHARRAADRGNARCRPACRLRRPRSAAVFFDELSISSASLAS